MWEDDLEAQARRKVAWLIGIVAVAAVGVGGWLWYRWAQHATQQPPAPPAAAPPASAASEAQVAHPIPAEGGTGALPTLNDSDAMVRDSIAGVLGKHPVEQFLVPQNIVRHVVVTVDNLPRHHLGVELRPVKPTRGQTVTATAGGGTTLSEANYARYAPLVHVVEGTDVKAVAVVYERLYPLFQQAYEDLGYPGKYFNDRLVEVIDDLLQTPEITGPIQLVQPKVAWQYADQSIESRSAGQKLLIRMGAANARVIKAKLREFRADIVQNRTTNKQ
ncbi:MAG: DUF3014 domain-containing protein [Gammaproteobacteria bacterium]|nr:DUF3014 domain-containing protein [Gammaproteobacteria bacterium]